MNNLKKGFGGRDLPSMQDYSPEFLGIEERGGSAELPDSVILRNISSLDQGTENSCTAHAGAHALMIIVARILKQKTIAADANWLWAKQFEFPGTADLVLGDYLQSMLRCMNRYGIPMLINGTWRMVQIEGYARAGNKKDIKKFLAAKNPLVSGSLWQGLDSSATQKFRNTTSGYGHIFVRTGYEKDLIRNMNSWGDDWKPDRKNPGSFYTKEDDLEKGFHSYMLKVDEDYIKDLSVGRKILI